MSARAMALPPDLSGTTKSNPPVHWGELEDAVEGGGDAPRLQLFGKAPASVSQPFSQRKRTSQSLWGFVPYPQVNHRIQLGDRRHEPLLT